MGRPTLCCPPCCPQTALATASAHPLLLQQACLDCSQVAARLPACSHRSRPPLPRITALVSSTAGVSCCGGGARGGSGSGRWGLADLALLCHLPNWPSSRPAPNTPVRVNLSQKAPLVPTALVPWSPRGVGADKAVFTRPRAGGQRYKDPILLAPAASPSPSAADIRGWVSQRGVPTPGGLLSHWPGHQGLPWLGTRTQLPLWAWGRRA